MSEISYIINQQTFWILHGAISKQAFPVSTLTKIYDAKWRHQRPFVLPWFNFNPRTDK